MMTIFPSEKGVSVTREFLQATKETPIKPSLLIVMNAKDNDIIDLIYDHTSLIPCCFTHWYSTYTERRSASETATEFALLSF